MEYLFEAEAIRQAIKKVMDDTTARRIAIVGFIGADPLKWIRQPRGMDIYCWPKPGGTDPRGIVKLLREGARVHFVMNLHAKVYYSSKGGTVLGSANWSDHALGEGGLTETAIWLPTGAFPIDEQLAKLGAAVSMDDAEKFQAMLQKLYVDHNIFYRANPGMVAIDNAAQSTCTFGEWAAQPGRQQWQLGLWYEAPDPPLDAVKEYAKLTSDDLGLVIEQVCSNYRAHSNPSNILVNIPTLDCAFGALERQTPSKIRPIWWIPSFKTTTSNPKFSEMKHIWLARENVPSGSPIPFDCKEKNFLSALQTIVGLLGEKIDTFQGPVSDEFVDLLLKHYQSLRGA